jgi:hypothetical protein
MSRPCSVCRHPQRAEIALTRADGASFQTVADRFGLSKTAVFNHHHEHVGAGLVKTAATIVKDAARRDAEVREYDEASTLLQKIERLEADARRIGERAEREGDLRAALVANAGLLNVVKMMHELMPAASAPEKIDVIFSFPPSGDQRTEFFAQRGASTASEAAGPASAIPGEDRDA